MKNTLSYVTGSISMESIEFWKIYIQITKKIKFDQRTKFSYIEVPGLWNIIIWIIYQDRIIFNEGINHEILIKLNSKNPIVYESIIKYLWKNNMINTKDYLIDSPQLVLLDNKNNISSKINSITNIEEWHDCFSIDEFKENYPWLYVLHSLSKNDETIIQYNKWWEITNIWFYSWDNILLFEWINKEKIQELEMHAVISATLINKRIEKILER